MLKFAPSCLNLWRQIICHFSVVLSLPLCAWADDAPLRILSPSQGGGVSQQSLNIEYSYDPAIFGKSPEVDVKIDGLDATITRGMAVKGTAPAQAPADDSQPSMQADSKSIQIPPLQQVQRAWITYRDKQIESYAITYGKMDGTMWIPIHAGAVMRLTKQRAQELENILGLLDERSE